MPAIKDLLSYTDKEIAEIVREDFQWSEENRAAKNERNWQVNQYYHCRELLTLSSMTAKDNTVGGGMRVIGAAVPQFELTAPLPNMAFIPWLRGIILTGISQQANAMWPDFEDFFRLDPAHENDEPAADAAFHAIKFFLRQSSYTKEAVLTLLQAAKYDFAIMYTGWKREFGWIPTTLVEHEQEMDYNTGEWFNLPDIEAEYQGYEMKESAVDTLDVFAINTFNFRYDPMATHDGFGEFAGPTYLMPKRKMHELVKSGYWPKSVLEQIKDDEPVSDNDNDDTTDDYDSRLKQDEHLAGHDKLKGSWTTKFIRVHQYHTKFAMVFLLNGRIVVRPKTYAEEPGRTIGWPFHKVVHMENEGMFSGTSLAEPLMPIQHDMNQMLRLMRAQQDRATNPDLVIDATMFKSTAEAKAQPWGTGAHILIRKNPDGRDVATVARYVVHPSNTAPDMWTAMQAQMSGGERAAGVSANAQTQAEGGSKTATEINEIAAGQQGRIGYIQKQAEVPLVIDVINRILVLIHLNVREELHVRIRGEKGTNFRTIAPRDLIFKRSPDVIALGMSSMGARGAASQMLRDALLALSNNPMYAQFIKVVPSLRQLFRSMDVDPDQFVNDENLDAASKMTQELENVLLASGIDVPINPLDNHEQHLETMSEFVLSDQFEDVVPETRAMFEKHAQAHMGVLSGGTGGLGAPTPAGPPNPAAQAQLPAPPGQQTGAPGPAAAGPQSPTAGAGLATPQKVVAGG